MIKSPLCLIYYRRTISYTLLQKYSWNFIVLTITEYETEEKTDRIGRRSDSKIFCSIESVVQLVKPTSTDLKRSAIQQAFPAWHPERLWNCHLTPGASSHSCVCCLRPSPNNFLRLWRTALSGSLKSFQNHQLQSLVLQRTSTIQFHNVYLIYVYLN